MEEFAIEASVVDAGIVSKVMDVFVSRNLRKWPVWVENRSNHDGLLGRDADQVGEQGWCRN